MSADHSIPDIVLERYRLGELPADDGARVKALAGQDPRVRERLDAIERSDTEFAAGELPIRIEVAVRARLTRHEGARGCPPSRRWRFGRARRSSADNRRAEAGGRTLVWGLATIAAAGVILFLIVPRGVVRPGAIPAPEAANDGDRIKGLRPALALYRRTAEGSETLADGAVARTGDLLRIGYRAAGRPYGVILSVDGRGSVTVHLPAAAARAVPLRRDATVLLDQAYELDDAPKWERFYFITGTEPFAVAPIVDAARRVVGTDHGSQAAALPLPPGLEQSSVAIQKEARP